MGEEERVVSPRIESITSNRLPLENFDAFNTDERPIPVTTDENNTVVVKIDIQRPDATEVNALQFQEPKYIESVTVTYEDNTTVTQVCVFMFLR
ncbi:hypothetical protein DPMN_179184 [Dreissena polymorpha]|uniref:Uncharacterized protein n=1 Tax=Dreissena polymorpha TaxID=45954 RepID=A0A9D4EDI1_DREPO|nr:hypothetical protein DPMN_179184 [Dreissena polymorpha]